MHELSIAESIIKIINSEAERSRFERVVEIRLALGEYSGIVPECIREFFPIAAKGTKAEGALLDFRTEKAVFSCGSCGYEGEIDRKDPVCPLCRSSGITMIHGREFFIDSIGVE